MRPEVFEVKFAAGAVLVKQEQAAAFGEAVGEIGKNFYGHFADPALDLNDACDRDVLAYSKISSEKC